MGFGDLVNTIGDAAEGAVDRTEKAVGGAVDGAAHGVGDALDYVGADSAAGWVDGQGDAVADHLGAAVAEDELGQSEDPKKLVHGDTQAIRTAAGHLRKFHSSFETGYQGLRRLDTSHWRGKAADAFREKFDPHPKQWLHGADACEQAAKALEAYADTVAWAQGQAKEAVEAYRSGTKANKDAADHYGFQAHQYNQFVDSWNKIAQSGKDPGPKPLKPDPQTFPGNADLARAKDTLCAARTQRDSAAHDAQRLIDAAAALAPATPDFADRMKAGAYGSIASTPMQLEHFTGGVVRGLADGLKFARGLNPVDPYNLSHPAQYLTQLNSTAAGLLAMPFHPERLPAAILGTGWGSDPDEASGRLAANVLLALATDGGSAGEVGAERTVIAGAERGTADGVTQTATEARDKLAEAPRDPAREDKAVSGNGDPVDMATGRMFLAQTDLALPGALPLLFSRKTVSNYRSGLWLGRQWACTADQRLEIDAEGVIFVREDGLLLGYPHPAPGVPTLPSEGPRWPLDRSADGSYTVTDPDTGRTWHFTPYDEDLALLSELTDRNGHRITFAYDPTGTPTDIRHNAGYHLRVSTAQGRITALHLLGADAGDTGTELIRYEHADGNLTAVINSSGLPMRFGYDDRGRITSWTDRNGSHYHYAYDEHDRCVYEGGAEGHLSYRFDYDQTDPATGLAVTAATNSLGHTTRYLINEALQVVAETDPLGATTRSTWDRYDRLLTRTDPLGHTVTYTYDEAGHPATITAPDGQTSFIAYNDLGLPTVMRTADGATWRQTYDDAGNRTSDTDPAGATTHYTYDEHGHLTSVTDALGHTTSIRCDAAGLPAEITDPLGATTRYTRDDFGRVTAVTDPGGSVTRMEWTIEGKPARRTAPDGATETWQYDGEGNLLTHTDPGGGTTRCEYTHFDQMSARTGPDGVRQEFTHDAELQLTTVTNPQGLTWTYTYDPAGRLAAESDFNDRTLTYTHDEAGRLTARTNGLGQTTTYAYNALGQPTTKTTETATTAFTYNPAGHLIHAANPDTDLTLHRDRLGRILTETVNDRTTIHTYDPLGQRTSRTTPTGATTTWTYNAAGNRTALTASGHTFTFDHDPNGRETARHFGHHLTLTHTWDTTGRLTHKALITPTGPIQQRAYTYRPDGNLTALDDHLTGPRTFDLDTAGRVTAVHAHNWTERYAYDDAGNQTDASWPATHPGQEATGPRTYTGTLIRSAGHIRYEHDAQGRVTLRQKTRLSRKPDTWRYTWDAEDHLTDVTTPDGTHWHYLYDPLGRRIAKQRLNDSGSIAEQTDFTWDGTTLTEQTTTSTQQPNAITLTWDHNGLHPIAQTERITAAKAPQEEIDQRFFAIITDLVGTPTELVDETGTLTYRARTTLWGTTTWTKTSTAYTPLRFPGQYFDPETTLHYNFHRHYDPETARYTTADPLGLTPDPNPNTYVHNPHTWTDPLGLSPYEESPYTLRRTEALSGNASKKNVEALVQSMKKDGWQGDPISVAQDGKDLYVLDGHHRVAAAKRAGINVPYSVVSNEALLTRYPGGIDEVTNAWAEVGADRLINPYKRPGYR